MIQNYVANQKRQLQSCINGFLGDALKSSGKLAASVLIFGGCLTMTGKYLDGARSPNAHLIRALLLTNAIALCPVAYFARRAKGDWQEWSELDSNRSELMSQSFASQVEALSQQSLLWWSHQQAAAQWQLQQQFGKAAQTQPQPVTVEAQALPATKPQPVDIARELAQTLKSSLIVGQPGSGKGLTVAHAIRHIKMIHPDVTIWAIDPKADPEESNRWNPCDRVMDVPLPAFATERDVERFQMEVESFIECFKLVKGRKLLIFDETLAVKELMPKWFKGIMAGFNHLCSTGRSKGVFGWLLSQTPNADDFGISGGARNVYRRVLLLSADDLGLICNRSTFFSGQPSDDELAATGRVFFDSLGNRWGVVPRLPDISEPALQRGSNGKPEGGNHDQLERMWNATPATPKHEELYHSKNTDADDPINKLSRYLEKKGSISRRTLLRNWANNHSINSQRLDALLSTLSQAGVVSLEGHQIQWIGWG